MTARSLPRFAFPVALGLVLILALSARAWRLTAWPLWLDEAYSAFAAERGLHFIWTILPTYETHPPFYSSVLSLWADVAGTSIFGFRALGLAASILTLPIVWAAARELARSIGQNQRWLGLIALALFAVAPSIVDMSRLVRPYYLMILVNAAGCWAMLRLSRGLYDEHRLVPAAWWSYIACLVLLTWLHSLGSLYAAALGLGLIIAAGPIALLRQWKAYCLGHLIAAAAVAPALYILADQSRQWTEATWLAFVPGNIPFNLLQIYGVDLMGAIIALVLTGAAITAMPVSRRRLGLALMALSLFPIVMALIISVAISPVFLVRTLVAASVPMLLLWAAGPGERLITRALFAILLLAAVITTVRMRAETKPDENWNEAVSWLGPKLAPGDVVYAYPNEGALPFRFALRYNGVPATIRDIPSGIPARDPAGWYPTGSRGVQSLPAWRLEQIADDPVSRRTPVIWLLRYNSGYYDRGDAFLKILKSRRDETARLALGPIEIVGLRQRPPAPSRKP